MFAESVLVLTVLHYQLVAILRIGVLTGVLTQSLIIQIPCLCLEFIAPRKDFLTIGVGSRQLNHIGIRLGHFKLSSLSWGSVRRLERSFLEDRYVRLSVVGRLHQLIGELTILQIDEVIAVLYCNVPGIKVLPLHRAPHLADGIVRAFLLHVGTYNAVASEVAHAVDVRGVG